jgi:hypothetical protein
METVIVIGSVLIAAVVVGIGIYRSATGNSSCTGCDGCQNINCNSKVS